MVSAAWLIGYFVLLLTSLFLLWKNREDLKYYQGLWVESSRQANNLLAGLIEEKIKVLLLEQELKERRNYGKES